MRLGHYVVSINFSPAYSLLTAPQSLRRDLHVYQCIRTNINDHNIPQTSCKISRTMLQYKQPPSIIFMLGGLQFLRTDIVAVGVKPTPSGYKPGDLGHLAISAIILYHILSFSAILFDHRIDHRWPRSGRRQRTRECQRAQKAALFRNKNA